MLNKIDRPLIASAVAALAVVIIAWPREADSRFSPNDARTGELTQTDSIPANYNAPALSAISATPVPKDNGIIDIVRDPSDLPAPVGSRGPRRVKVDLDTIEVTGQLADGATYRYWTFNGRVPGPFVRVRVGDIVQVHLKNDAGSSMNHNVDFHAVIGPGGGAKATEAAPGETRGFEFKAEHPGLYVYHCAVSMAAMHIANGMYGMILVEPAGGLPKVDHEYYVMQGEFYTQAPFGGKGLQTQSYDKLMNETPDYYVFNGAVGALSERKPLHAKVGESVRIFFGNGGPNKISSLHAVGEVFDHAYQLGVMSVPPLRDVQTITVPPGGAAAVDMDLKVPGKFMIVDHALTRIERGLTGMLIVDGPAAPDLYKDYDPPRSAMVMSH
jgi:nitrite reductase (NO-forming)